MVLYLRFLAAVVAAVAATYSAHADLRERYTIHDEGQTREFDVATDEISARDAQGTRRKIAVAPAANAEAIRGIATAHARQTGEDAELVLYETGRRHSDFTRRVLTRRIAVQLRPGTDAAALATRMGLEVVDSPVYAPGWVILAARQTGGALDAADALATQPGVLFSMPQLGRKQSKRLIPNDTLFSQQWHLRNTGQSGATPGIDANVTSVWDTWKGNGIRIGIVDDGLQLSHPDLSPNVDTVNDHDWNDATPNDPSPDLTFDYHGTACAGVAAGRGSNALGISGAAPNATLVGLRLISGSPSDQDEADAENWRDDIIQVKSNSWGPDDDGLTLKGPDPLAQAALQNAAQTGRGGLGTIICWAAGNGLESNDNSNYDGYANSRFVIAVAALDSTGHQSYYSEPGANILVAAPSSGDGAALGITTTDLVGNDGYNDGTLIADKNYTNDFGGTSSACPLVAGVAALVLQSKPTLGWRDVQEILIRSATKVDATDSDWINNGAGWHFNHKYGAGLVNAQAAVTLASTWKNLTAEQNVSSAQTGLSVGIPDNSTTGITRSFNLSSSNLRVERATVKVNINHAFRGQLAITLTSPSGTASRLAEKHADDGNNYADWTFSTVRCWGESSKGTWTLKITDLTSGTTGTLTSATLNLYGTPDNLPPSVTAANISPANVAYTDQTLSVSGVVASDPENNPITLGYEWQESGDGATFTPIAGATNATFPLTAVQSGKLVRCSVTGSDASGPGAPFLTAAVTVNQRPLEFARHGVAYTYDSDLFFFAADSAFPRNVIINEFSQGTSGSKDWVELIVLQTSDLRGYTLRDRSGAYTTFANVAAWSAAPAGLVIVIYNGGDRDTVLPADDSNPAGNTMVLPHNNLSLFLPGTWGGFINTANGDETVEIRDAGGAVVDAVSFNGNTTYQPVLGAVGNTTAAAYGGDTEPGAEVLGNWNKITAVSATPAAGNSPANSAFITALRNGTANQAPFRFGATSDIVPGLTLDPVTGVIGGNPDVPAGGLFHLVIERFSSSAVTSQSYPLLVADSDGNYVIPAGKSLILDQPLTLAGNLLVAGSLDTAGYPLVVNGLIAVTGTVTNSTGSISYRQRSGPLIHGATMLVADPVNDLADDDHDGLSNLVEFALGLDPSQPDAAPLASPTIVSGHLTLTYTLPVGPMGATTTAQYSTNLTTWNTGAGFTQIVSDTTTSGVRTIVVRAVPTTARSFLRLRVSR